MDIKILLLDDEDRGEYTVDFLDSVGFDIKWHKDPNSYWEKEISNNLYNVLILDIMMPLIGDKYLCQDFKNEQGLSSGLHILIYIREQLKIDNSKLTIILRSARNQLNVNEILGSSRHNYYDKYIRKSDESAEFLEETLNQIKNEKHRVSN